MSKFAASVVVSALVASPAPAAATQVQANPIRKVVNLLQKMQEKVIAEGEKEQKLHDAFMCQCKTGSGDLTASSAAATDKIPQLAAHIEKLEEERTQTKEDLGQAQADRVSAKKALAEAGAMRTKEAGSFADESAEYNANINAMTGAVASLEKGMAGSFVQTSAAQKVLKIAQGDSVSNIFEDDRQKLIAFLGGGAGSTEETPGSAEITGILKQMGDEMAAGLKAATEAENQAIAAYDNLVATRNKELASLQKAIEEKLKRNGDLSIEIRQMKNDQTDTEEALAADQKSLAGMQEACQTKTSEFEERTKTRGQELQAIADTIKMLNSDDALELFKKTLPSASSSFLQVQVSASILRARALAELSRVPQGPRRLNLDLIGMALRGKTAGFEKVVGMIDAMVKTLQKEQTDDDNKKEECEVQLDHADDQRKALERSQSDEEKAIATAQSDIASTIEEINALKKGLRALDRSVAEATKQRQDENMNYKELMQSDGAAKELIGIAKNRMQKFYNPKLATGLLETTARKQESSSVLNMMDELIRDLDKEMTEAEAEEKNAQASYETMTNNAAQKRSADAKSLTQAEATKAALEEALEQHTEAKNDFTKELAATNQFIHALHLDCDFLLKHFDFRKQAREGEVDALGKAKAVLSGADYSLVQTQVQHRHLRRAN